MLGKVHSQQRCTYGCCTALGVSRKGKRLEKRQAKAKEKAALRQEKEV